MTKPTREEVEKWKYESAHSPLHDHAFENHNRLIYLADAYLAQGEELNSLVNTLLERDRELLAIQAENQALRVELDSYYQAWCASDPEGNPSSSG